MKRSDAVVLAAAMEQAVETAYKAVMKPKEGTILTVAKGGCGKSSRDRRGSSKIWSCFF